MIEKLTNILTGIIFTGTILRLILCLIRAFTDDEQSGTYWRRARHVIYFLIFAACIVGIKGILLKYYIG